MNGLEQIDKATEMAIANEKYRQYDTESAKRKKIIADALIVAHNDLDYETYVCVMEFFELSASLSREEVEYVNELMGGEKK